MARRRLLRDGNLFGSRFVDRVRHLSLGRDRGDPEKSLLIHVIRRDEGFPRMPKSKPKLPDRTVAAFIEWIKEGAPWPAHH